MSRIMQNEVGSTADEGSTASTRRELVQNDLSNRSSETHRTGLEIPKWNIISEVINCQIGKNPLFQRRFYGSLYGVQRLELKSHLFDKKMGKIRSLNFNGKGNLLANVSHNKIFIWDWAIGKRLHLLCVEGDEQKFPLEAKWLNMDSLIISNPKGEVFLIHLNHSMLEKVAMIHEESKLTVLHDETSHVVLSAGENGSVFSIDVRQKKTEKLFEVKTCEGLTIPLNSIDSNPFNSNEFCLSGESCYVRVYDRRNVLTPLCKLSPHYMELCTECYYAVYNYSGTEILASYCNEEIYLFNMLKFPCRVTHTYKSYFDKVYGGGAKFFGPKSEFVISGSNSGNIFIWDKNTEAIVKWIKSNEPLLWEEIYYVEGHPHLPILATQEARSHIGIWQPFV